MTNRAQAFDPVAFARAWADAWNRHDADGVLQHFDDDVTFTSPVAARLLPETGGVIRGKEALRSYWVQALRLVPDLRFTVDALYAGVGSLVIRYRNQEGVEVAEVLVFRDGKVHQGFATYPADISDPAGVEDGTATARSAGVDR